MINKRFYYVEHHIPKDDGSTRTIQEPSTALKLEQKYILSILQKEKLKCIFGFVKGKGIIDNAIQHMGALWSIHVDIKGFFPSINPRRVRNLLNKNHIPPHYMDVVTYKNQIPQGSPASPRLANLAAYELDMRFIGLSKKLNIVYTRYADDLVFSGKGKIDTEKLTATINHIIRSCGFKVNDKKTQIVYGNERGITGIYLCDNRMFASHHIIETIKTLCKLKEYRRLTTPQQQKLTGLLAFVTGINSANERLRGQP